MNKKQLRERITREIEAEAAALEKRAAENEDLSSLEMPEDSYLELMERVAAQETAETVTPTASGKSCHIRRRTLLAVALIAILGVGAGLGASGAKLFVVRVENRGDDGEVNIAINNDEEYVEITEDEAYEEIEEKLGILALRLQYKPQGMELKKIYVDEIMGEALLEFYYGEHILTVYENKQKDSSSFKMQFDGKFVGKIEHFHLGQELEIIEIDNKDANVRYQTQIEYGNAYYYLSSDIDLKEFENILKGLMFKEL